MRNKKIVTIMMTLIMLIMCIPLGTSAASEAHFTLSEVMSEGSSTINVGGQKWYKVKNFDDDKDYIITVKNSIGESLALTITDDNKSSCIWNYYRQSMTSSVTPRFSSLRADSYYLVCNGNKLSTAYTRSVKGDLVWEHVGSALRYNEEGNYSYLKYDEESEEQLSFTTELSEAAKVDIYTNGEQLERCIVSHPHAESYVIEGSNYPAPVFEVGLDNVTVDDIFWYVDDKLQTCKDVRFTADVLRNLNAGTHRISCLVEASDNSGIRYREKSETALFVITKGVVPDSVLTFSDVHEEYERIGDAIGNVIERSGGYIPSLIICTGDFVNGTKAENDIMLSKYYPRIVAELGGLDAVFVSGNHDSGSAASAMSAAADLGASETLSASGGKIFSGNSEKVSLNGKNSKYARNIIVYGLNQEATAVLKNDLVIYSYENVIDDVDKFLKETAENYNGELVIISAHTGLHALGIQPDSIDRNGVQLNQWIGENAYNIDKSYDLASIINNYAKQYDMDIMYLFGHDHSRYETEMLLKSGDELISTISYNDKTTANLFLDFTYAHAGYLSTEIGSADTSFSFIYRDGDEFSYNLIRTSDNRTKQTSVEAKNIPEEPVVTTAVTTITTTTATTTTSVSTGRSENPKTGDSSNVVLILFPVIALMLSSKRKNRREE